MSNEALICVYDAVNREFAWVNRTFEPTRNGYNQRMKDAARNGVPRDQALVKGSYATAQDHLKKWLEEGNQMKMGKMQRISDLMDIPPILRKREGANGQFNDVINLKSAHFGALSNAQAIKKGKGKEREKHASRKGWPVRQRMLPTTFTM